MRDNVEFLELPGGGKYQSVSATQHNGRTQVDEVEADLARGDPPSSAGTHAGAEPSLGQGRGAGTGGSSGDGGLVEGSLGLGAGDRSGTALQRTDGRSGGGLAFERENPAF